MDGATHSELAFSTPLSFIHGHLWTLYLTTSGGLKSSLNIMCTMQ